MTSEIRAMTDLHDANRALQVRPFVSFLEVRTFLFFVFFFFGSSYERSVLKRGRLCVMVGFVCQRKDGRRRARRIVGKKKRSGTRIRNPQGFFSGEPRRHSIYRWKEDRRNVCSKRRKKRVFFLCVDEERHAFVLFWFVAFF